MSENTQLPRCMITRIVPISAFRPMSDQCRSCPPLRRLLQCLSKGCQEINHEGP
ncbi:hypothetical protein OG21DRAFT_1506341 [Imleria badia]|nr:hypothetical protein OG21DRAFT_1506341 [Imleria badia]